jgi:proline dehydrogenase
VSLCQEGDANSEEHQQGDGSFRQTDYRSRNNPGCSNRGKGFVAIATHDELLVAEAIRLLRELNVPKERYEFQMLLGVREPLRNQLLAHGEPVCIYVPYGNAVYDYGVRRLNENPAVAGYVFKAMLGMG